MGVTTSQWGSCPGVSPPEIFFKNLDANSCFLAHTLQKSKLFPFQVVLHAPSTDNIKKYDNWNPGLHGQDYDRMQVRGARKWDIPAKRVVSESHQCNCTLSICCTMSCTGCTCLNECSTNPVHLLIIIIIITVDLYCAFL